MQVERQLEDWPERAQRRSAWFTPEAAARLVETEALAAMLARMEAGFAHVLDLAPNGPAINAPKERKREASLKQQPFTAWRPDWWQRVRHPFG